MLRLIVSNRNKYIFDVISYIGFIYIMVNILKILHVCRSTIIRIICVLSPITSILRARCGQLEPNDSNLPQPNKFNHPNRLNYILLNRFHLYPFLNINHPIQINSPDQSKSWQVSLLACLAILGSELLRFASSLGR